MIQRRSADGPFAASWARAREIQQEAHADATVASLRAAAIRSVVLYRDPATKAVLCLADSPQASPTVLAARECEAPNSAPSTASDIWPESVANDTPGDAPSGCLLVRRLQLLSPRSAGVSSSPAVVQSRALAILGGKHASPAPISLKLNSARIVSTGLPVTPLDNSEGGYAAAAVDNSAADIEGGDEAAAAVAGCAAAASRPPGSASLAAQHARPVTLARPPTRDRQAEASQMLAATVEAVSSAVQTAEAAVRAAAANRSRSHSRSRSATPSRSRSRSGSRSRGRPVAAGAGGHSSSCAGVRDADAGGAPQANAGSVAVAVGSPHAIGSAMLQPTSASSRSWGGATGAAWEPVEPAFMRPADGHAAPALPPLPPSTRSSTSNDGALQLQLQPPAYSVLPHAAAADLSASACANSSHDGPAPGPAPELRGASACAPAAAAAAAGHPHARDCHVCRAENSHVALALDSCARGRCGGEAQPCDAAPPLLSSARFGWCACADSGDRGAASAHDVPPRVIAATLPLPQLGYFPSVHVSVGYGAAPAAAVWSHPMSDTALPAGSHRYASADCSAPLARSCHAPPRLRLASAPLAQQAQISAACCTAPQAWAALAPPTLSQADWTLPVPAVARAVPPSAAAPPIPLASAFLLQRQDAPASMPAAPGPLQAAAGSSAPLIVRPHATASGPAAAPFHKAFAQAHAMMEELRAFR